MKQVVLLTDFSENSFHAILYAINFFENEVVRFHILHIKDSRGLMLDDLVPSSVDGNIQAILLEDSKKKLDKLLLKINNLSVNKHHQFTSSYLFDPFFEAINKYCSVERIQTLIMGTMGASGAKQFFLGSMAAKVINNVEIPILVIPKDSVFTSIGKVLFSVDYKINYLPITLAPVLPILKNTMPRVYELYVNERHIEFTDEQLLNKNKLHELLKSFSVTKHKITSLPLDQTLSCLIEFLQIDLLVMIKKEKSLVQKIINSSHIRKVSYHLKTPLLILPK